MSLHSNYAFVATFSFCLLDKFVCFVIKMQKKFVLAFEFVFSKEAMITVHVI